MSNQRESETREHTQRETGDADHESAAEDKTPALEWIASALGLIVVLGAFGLILYDASVPDTPPRLKAGMTRIVPFDGRYLVEVTVRNQGGSTAGSVNVEGTLMRGDKTIETASTTFDYVPAGSDAEGGMFFTHDPRAYELQFDANAYQAP